MLGEEPFWLSLAEKANVVLRYFVADEQEKPKNTNKPWRFATEQELHEHPKGQNSDVGERFKKLSNAHVSATMKEWTCLMA